MGKREIHQRHEKGGIYVRPGAIKKKNKIKKELKRRKRESSHVLKRGQIYTSAAFNVFLGLLHRCGAL